MAHNQDPHIFNVSGISFSKVMELPDNKAEALTITFTGKEEKPVNVILFGEIGTLELALKGAISRWQSSEKPEAISHPRHGGYQKKERASTKYNKKESLDVI